MSVYLLQEEVFVKTVLISGAGSGIGRAIAVRLSHQNMRVILLGRRQSALEETILQMKNSDQHFFVPIDIRELSMLPSVLEEHEVLELDAVISNAGIGGENQFGPEDRWQDILDVNLTGPYQLVNYSLPYLRRRTEPYGHIIFISSILARLGVPKYSAYCASKSGLLGLMRSMAVEYASEKILVNAICPGWVETDMAREGLEAMAKASGREYEIVKNHAMKDVLLGKMSQPEEIAALIAFLISGEQISFTGQSFDMNNGALMPA